MTLALNIPERYWYVRLWSLPMRVSFLGVIAWRLLAAESNAMAFIAFLACMALYAVDFVLGDLSAVQNYRHHCSYEVIRILPNRVILCKRHGAAHYAEENGI